MLMKRLTLYLLIILLLPSCVSKKYLKKHGFSNDIASMVEKTYLLEEGKENLITIKSIENSRQQRQYFRRN